MVNFSGIKYEILFVIEKDNEDDVEDTINIINEYMIDMNYKILYSNGSTVGLARNVGLEEAEGEYVWFIDGDDWIINPEVVYQALTLLK